MEVLEASSAAVSSVAERGRHFSASKAALSYFQVKQFRLVAGEGEASINLACFLTKRLVVMETL